MLKLAAFFYGQGWPVCRERTGVRSGDAKDGRYVARGQDCMDAVARVTNGTVAEESGATQERSVKQR